MKSRSLVSNSLFYLNLYVVMNEIYKNTNCVSYWCIYIF